MFYDAHSVKPSQTCSPGSVLLLKEMFGKENYKYTYAGRKQTSSMFRYNKSNNAGREGGVEGGTDMRLLIECSSQSQLQRETCQEEHWTRHLWHPRIWRAICLLDRQYLDRARKTETSSWQLVHSTSHLKGNKRASVSHVSRVCW